MIDLATGSQPVANEAGDVVAVFNGELYNFRELRAELAAATRCAAPATRPSSRTCTRSTASASSRGSRGCSRSRSGTRARERLVLARDRVGKKPLLWTRLPDGSLAFASELKALLRLPGVSRELDPAALDAYLALQYVPGRHGACAGSRSCRPATCWSPRAATFGSSAYWELGARARESSTTRSGSSASARRSERPSGSGSSPTSRSARCSPAASTRASSSPRWPAPAAASAPSRSDSATTATTSAPTPARVAERFGTEHEEIVVEPDVAELLPRLARTFDEPLGDEAALPQYVVSELARRHVTVALTGDGGDEAFAGYERYAAIGLADRVALPGAGIGRARAALGRPRRAALAREPRGPAPRGRFVHPRRRATGG